MKSPSTSAPPPSATPRQLTMGFESIQLRLTNSAQRAVVLTHLDVERPDTAYRKITNGASTSSLTLTIIHAQGRGVPEGSEKTDWKLITDLPIRSCNDVIEKLDWHAMRWKIETFHKILTSGSGSGVAHPNPRGEPHRRVRRALGRGSGAGVGASLVEIASVSNLAAFLVSDAARRITGTVIPVDGSEHLTA
jgi:hypothetical protein